MTSPLSGDFADRADQRLADTDALVTAAALVDRSARQPIHTVYLPADRFGPDISADWAAQAQQAMADAGGLAGLAALVDVDDDLVDRVGAKLATEPIEDLRIDFEDGYGARDDATEDADVRQAVRTIADTATPPFIGIRFKSFEPDTRRRGLRTLELFVLGLAENGPLPTGLRLTLPKVSTADQVEIMADGCALLEQAAGLPNQSLRFELQMETAPMICDRTGRSPIPAMIAAGDGRVSGIHYGTYDYSDSLDVAAPYQSMEHPAADHAKAVMQVAVAGTGVQLSDGSTNVLPVGDLDRRAAAWQLHARLVRRSLERGYYQGWDLHPAQLPTRYLATYAFYRQAFEVVAGRLAAFAGALDLSATGVADEPATIRPLARFLGRGLRCGALDVEEITDRTGLGPEALLALARPRGLHSERI